MHAFPRQVDCTFIKCLNTPVQNFCKIFTQVPKFYSRNFFQKYMRFPPKTSSANVDSIVDNYTGTFLQKFSRKT